MDEIKLFAVMLGGRPVGAGTEVHDVVFAVGPSLEATRDQLLAAWFAPDSTPHIDSWMELDVVDGARVVPVPGPATAEGPSLWHVHLGYYEPGQAGFREGHEDLFVIAADADQAKARAKRLARRAPAEQMHTDAIHTVSDRLAACGSPYRIQVLPLAAAATACPSAHDGYLPFA